MGVSSIRYIQKGDMAMKTNRNLVAIGGLLIACVFVVWFSSSIHGGEETYRIEPEITVPEYRTDAARAIDAYERLMERYMNLTEKSLFGLGNDVQDIDKKLDRIEQKLKELCSRMARVEKALGVDETAKSTWQDLPLESPDEMLTEDSSAESQP
jgi:hypothetical protein